MAKCEIKLADEIYKSFEKLSQNTPKIIEKMLKDAGKVVLETAKSNLKRAVTNSSDRSTGELVNSLGLSSVKIDHNGIHNIKVGFNEPRLHQPKSGKYAKYRKTNAMVANILEYGKRDNSQSARPFMRPARETTKRQIPGIMEHTWDAEIEKLGVK